MIIPDTSTTELETFVRRLFCPGEEQFYTAVANTAVPGTDNPDMFHTAVPQTPHHLPSELVDRSDSTRREIKQRLDLIHVSLSLLKA